MAAIYPKISMVNLNQQKYGAKASDPKIRLFWVNILKLAV
jgi:hypothetical protein